MAEGQVDTNNYTEGAGTKRSNEGGNWQGGKKMRGDSVTLRFLLNSKHAGGIIGKGGETIKRLRSEYSATVTVPDTNTNERVLSIGADKENVLKVLRDCLPLVHEPPYPVNTGGQGKEPCMYEIDFLVHSSQVGGIIGRAGFKIKQLREETNASIKVYQECLPDSTERVVAVGGDEEQIVLALQQMLDVMQEQPIKGNITLYDPSYDHSTPGYEDNYYGGGGGNNFNGPPQRGGGGGMGGGMRGGRGRGGRGGGMGGPPRGGMGGNFGGGPPQGGFGGQGGNLMGGQQDFGNSYGGGNNYGGSNFNQGGQQGGGDGAFGGAGGTFGNNGGGSFGGAAQGGAGGGGAGGAPPTTTQVTIPNDMAGAIIGKGGERIRGIRQKCGADIKFSDSDPAKKDRLITISGTQDQIQYAQYLMQQCVRQHSGGN